MLVFWGLLSFGLRLVGMEGGEVWMGARRGRGGVGWAKEGEELWRGGGKEGRGKGMEKGERRGRWGVSLSLRTVGRVWGSIGGGER